MARTSPKKSLPERRGHPALKFNAKAAEAFGIQPGADPPRETVQVDAIPDPPEAVVPGPRAPQRVEPLNIEESVVNILREESEEIAVRLNRFGVAFPPNLQQELVDHVFAMLALSAQGMAIGGGAIASR